MMRSVRFLNLVSASVLLGLLGCAAIGAGRGQDMPSVPDRGNESKRGIEDVVFKFDARGNLVLVTEDGRPYETCQEKGKNVCRIFRDKIKISKLKSITILQMQYDVNPEKCRYIKIIQNGIEENLIHPADRHKDC